MTIPEANEEGYGGAAPPGGLPAGVEGDAAELGRVREAMDRLVVAYLEREEAKKLEEKLEGEAPDPFQTFSGIEEMLAFNRERERHDASVAGARERSARADEEYARASGACAFVPERASVYHALSGAVFLVRREPPPVSYAGGNDAEAPSAPGRAVEGDAGTEDAGPADGEGGGVFFVITFRGTEDGGAAEGAPPTSALHAQRRTPVGERMAGERTGRGASRRRGRREGPG